MQSTHTLNKNLFLLHNINTKDRTFCQTVTIYDMDCLPAGYNGHHLQICLGFFKYELLSCLSYEFI